MLLRRRAFVIAVPVLSAVAVASDFVLLPGFWDRHPLTAGIVSGLVLLLVGIAVVDSVLEAHSARRWRTAAHVGFKALARSIEEALDDLRFAFTGEPPPYATYVAPWNDECSKRLQASCVLTGDLSTASLADRLRNPSQSGALEEALVALRLRHRERLGQWLPAFISVGALAQVAERLAQFNETLGSVQGPVSNARKTNDRDAAVDGLAECALELLEGAVRAGVDLQTQLMHGAGADWFVPEPRHLRLLER